MSTPLQLDLGVVAPPPGGSLDDAPIISDWGILARCSDHKVVFDCETTGLHWWKHRVIGVAFWCPDAGVTGYVPVVDHNDVRMLREIMLAWSPETVVINQNIKFDFHFMGIDPWTVPWRYYDTMVMAHLYDSRGVPRPDGTWDTMKEGQERGAMGLGRLAQHYLHDGTKQDYQRLMREGNKRVPHHKVPVRILSRYAVEDARLSYEVGIYLGARLRQRGQIELLDTTMRYLAVLWRCERHGLHLDVPYLLDVQQRITEQLRLREQELFGHPKIAGTFDWRSTQQLSRALYERYDWRKPSVAQSTAGRKITGAATSSDILLNLAKHPLAPLIVQMRGLDKMRGYVVKWLDLMDNDHFLHPSFNQTATVTARLSSSDPNTQQIPGDERNVHALNAFEDVEALEAFYAATNMRKAFTATEGRQYVACDYAQQEVRMFAVMSKDPAMLQAINSYDVHAEMAHMIWGKRENPWRDWAKTQSLGMMYGMGEERLQTAIGGEASRVMAQYHANFPGIKSYSRQKAKQIEAQGYVTYWSGRRYYRSDSRGFHKAVNAIVQGGSADLMMVATVALQERIEREGWPVNLINFVHDEVDFEIDTDALPELVPLIAEHMQMEHLFGVPFLVDMKAGSGLGSMEKLARLERH